VGGESGLVRRLPGLSFRHKVLVVVVSVVVVLVVVVLVLVAQQTQLPTTTALEVRIQRELTSYPY